ADLVAGVQTCALPICRSEPEGPTKHLGAQLEARYALAKWGEIWGNPTLYAEYVQNHRAPDKVEGKLLFADDLCDGWHWATNLVRSEERRVGKGGRGRG